MTKEQTVEVQQNRKDQLSKSEELASLKYLRRKGFLSRKHFRIMTFDHHLQGSTKGSPLYTNYEFVEDKLHVKRVQSKVQQWTRI